VRLPACLVSLRPASLPTLACPLPTAACPLPRSLPHGRCAALLRPTGGLWGAALAKVSELVSDTTSATSISEAAKLYCLVGQVRGSSARRARALVRLYPYTPKP
jgi:hypothetical protein